MKYSLDNIGDWVVELGIKSRTSQFYTYCRVVRDEERQKKEHEILRECKLESLPGCKEVYIVVEDMAVIKVTDAHKNVYYVPYVAGKHSYEVFKNLDIALLAAISMKYTDDTTSSKYAAKIMEVPF